MVIPLIFTTSPRCHRMTCISNYFNKYKNYFNHYNCNKCYLHPTFTTTTAAFYLEASIIVKKAK
jgi:hypothetical protein